MIKDKQNREAAPQSLSGMEKWIRASRPKTLFAAAAPVIVGSAFALWEKTFRPVPAAAALAGAFLLQIGANLANDVFDYQRGVDEGERYGPKRATQEGWLSPRAVKWGVVLVFGIAALIGIYLSSVAGWPVIVIGLTAIISAVIYSGGPFPIGYHALGDIFVFLYFGIIGVSGTYFVQARQLSFPVVTSSVAVGFLIVNILVVNNYRDLKNDRRTGKITLAVRIGPQKTRNQFLANLVAAYLIPVILTVLDVSYIGSALVLGSFPLAKKLVQELRSKKGQDLNQTLADTGKFALIYAVLFIVGGTISQLLLG